MDANAQNSFEYIIYGHSMGIYKHIFGDVMK